MLAFLGAGSTHREGPHRDTVRKGLRWLQQQQGSEGSFGQRKTPDLAYHDALAALALSEAYAITRSPTWKSSAQLGIDFLSVLRRRSRARSPGERSGNGQLRFVAWMILALRSARSAELAVDEESFPEALQFVEKRSAERSRRASSRREAEVSVGGRSGPRSDPSPELLTALEMLVRIHCGQDPKTTQALKQGAELVLQKLPAPAREVGAQVDLPFWHLGTIASFWVGGRSWISWNNRIKAAVIDRQRTDGNFKGSWDPVGPGAKAGGRVFSTALMTLCLEIYYRYGRPFGSR